MPLSTSILRRYTPPTCTLQIVADSSALSRWARQPVLKQLQFELRLDDPRLPEEKQVTIQGNSEQLEALQIAVTSYVQELLKQSPEQFNVLLSSPATPNVAARGTTEEPEVLDSAPAITNLEAETNSHSSVKPAVEIFLQSGKGLYHNLLLGSLATVETGEVIQLSTLQLFDLATALDEYAADGVALPNVNSSRLNTTSPAWASIAAVVVLAVGITGGVLMLNRPVQQQTATTKVNPGASSRDEQQIALNQPPPLTTLPSVPPLNSPGVSPSPIPLVKVPATALPPPNIANSLKTPQTNPTPTGVVKSPQSSPDALTFGTTQAPAIVINPNAIQPQPGSGNRKIPTASPTPSPSALTVPPLVARNTPLPSISPFDNSQLNAARTNGNTASQPEFSYSPGGVPSTAITPAQAPSPTSLADSNPNSTTQERSPNPTTTPPQTQTTAYVSNPQIKEVRDYLQQRWEPPRGLKQTLEYSLVLDIDGTIQRIEPLGEAAMRYVDRSGIPLIGEKFVSPNTRGETPRIRVVLQPDAKVLTFLESP